MMQLQINQHRQEQSQNYQFNVINHGKLPHSSYYDLLDQEPSIENAAEEALIEDDQNIRVNGFINENLKVWACAFSPEPHDYLAWSCGYGLLRLLSLTSSSWLSKHDIPVEIDIGETITSLAFGSSCSSLKHRRHAACSGVYRRFHFDEKNNMLILAIGLTSGRIRIYNARDARFLFGLFDHSGLVSDLKFTQDGSLQLCSASADSTLKLWNMYDDGNMYMTLHGHTGTVYGCDWSPVANILCSVGANRDALIWSLDNNQVLHRLKGHLNDVVSCQFSPDGGLLATASFDTRVCLWDPYTGILIRQLLHLVPVPGFIYAGGHNGSFVRDVKWSANGDVLVTICDDGKIRIWSVIDNFKSVVEATHRNGLRLAFSSKWRMLLVGNRNGYLERFEVNLPVPKLTALCRKVVNQLVDRNNIEKLYLPLELKNYLTYDDFKQTFGNKNHIIEKNFN